MRAFLLCLVAFGIACSPEREPGELFGPQEAGVLVIDAQLIVDEPMPALFLRRTADPAGVYDASAYGVTDAMIEIRHSDGVIDYRADPDSAGRYLPQDTGRVQPLTEYRLTARVGDEVLSARTQTPGRLVLREAVVLDEVSLLVDRPLALFGSGVDVFAAPTNQISYLKGLLEMRLEPIEGAAGFQLSLFSLDPESDFVIDADFLEEDDYEEFERQGSSPALDGDDGNLRLPWFAVAFAGRHVWRTYALDANWHDWARTDPDTGGGGFGELAGDSFQRPLFRVEGGIGLFGSASVDSVGFVVLPSLEE